MERVMRSTIIVNPKLREREGQASTYLVDAQRKSAHSTEHTRHIAAQETHTTHSATHNATKSGHNHEHTRAQQRTDTAHRNDKTRSTHTEP